MALCNIVGDCGYLGFAFAAEGFVSLPKLFGACFTILAHIILLAYGDDQARVVAAEKGRLSKIVLLLREKAQSTIKFLPEFICKAAHTKPVGVPFSMLALNGVGLFTDAFLRFRMEASMAMGIQLVMGVLIVSGCCAFAAADFVKKQRAANILTKIAPTLLTGATIAIIGLAATTRNFFIIGSLIAFALSNIAGFFTKIRKEKGQHLHS